jgi:acyl carrier protein
MTDDEIIEALQRAAESVVGHRIEGVTIESQLSDLGVDSVGVLEMLGDVEKTMAVEFNDDEMGAVVSVRDFVGLVRTARAAAERARDR